MAEYLITWRTDIEDADSPQDAARQALALMASEESRNLRAFFEVEEVLSRFPSDGRPYKLGETVEVDLYDESQAASVAPPALKTWTFVGHWDNDRIVVEHTLEGEHDDERVDTGYWEQGLFASSHSGATIAEAEATMRAEYETDDDENRED